MSDQLNNQVLNLMQNVSNSLEEISLKIDEQNSSNSNRENDEKITNQLEMLNSKCQNIISIEKNLRASINENEQNILLELNNKSKIPAQIISNEYSLIGKESVFKARHLKFLIVGLFIVVMLAEYALPYYVRRSDLVIERDRYELFFKYILYLNFRDGKEKIVEETFNKVVARDSSFIVGFQNLEKSYNDNKMKKELQNQLDKLESNDR
ncbi:hypothetical protein SAMN05192588_0694 [Nonlabens sp. Hel1_33_55]|uniref:hypothetical protein n=1 Tax=Nonlabens sp. Hel1_33_55 TaxID=1336802 RepID=UPI000875BEE2|nr:hypothetical protein [Nonlabens sp. Hel1_33_55]SCY00594.1 hypothetical protein SAMN05192588_0694 [Nonlabens sp. Hel1_33_55]